MSVDEAEIERAFQLEHGDGSDYGALTKGNSREDILLMKHAFRNEKGSPEILLYEENLVFTVKDLVANQVREQTGLVIRVWLTVSNSKSMWMNLMIQSTTLSRHLCTRYVGSCPSERSPPNLRSIGSASSSE